MAKSWVAWAQGLLKNMVNLGGVYIGICAGAYFAAKAIDFIWADGRRLRAPRELAFFEGEAIGPVFPPYAEHNLTGAKAAPIQRQDNGQGAYMYYSGGGTFKGSAMDILATYEETGQPAIIRCQVGAGVALLSGVHFEVDPTLSADCAKRQAIYQALQKDARTIEKWMHFWITKAALRS